MGSRKDVEFKHQKKKAAGVDPGDGTKFADRTTNPARPPGQGRHSRPMRGEAESEDYEHSEAGEGFAPGGSEQREKYDHKAPPSHHEA